jgi:hypothetical protein
MVGECARGWTNGLRIDGEFLAGTEIVDAVPVYGGAPRGWGY